MAYAMSITVNGIAPFLAFKVGRNKQWSWILLVMIIPVAFYYFLGLKAPVMYALLAFMFGISVAYNKQRFIPHYMFLMIIIMFMIFLIEFAASGYSLMGEYTFRRYFVVNGRDVGRYMEMMFGNYGWSLLDGIHYSKGVTYLIGKIYYTENSNVDTNALIYAMASGGIFLYVIIVLLIGFYYVMIDAYYKKYGGPEFLFLGVFYGLIISEQSATTALASSGYLLLLVMSIIETRRMVMMGAQLQ